MSKAVELLVWRHPIPVDVQGLCLGRSDVPVDARKVKRLAHRIQQLAKRHRWPKVIHTSPLQRGALVGACLARWGWVHVVDEGLLELDFGQWELVPWSHIAQADIDHWCHHFATHPPGGGESLQHLLQRVQTWVTQQWELVQSHPQTRGQPVLVVGHAGWMLALQWLQTHGPEVLPLAHEWPAAPRYGHLRQWAVNPETFQPDTP